MEKTKAHMASSWLLVPSCALHGAAALAKSTIIYYAGHRDHNTLNIMTSHFGLPAGTDLWGFIDFDGAEGSGQPIRYDALLL